jgi:type VI secretion system protein ImpC
VSNTETGTNPETGASIKIKVLNVSKRELFEDLDGTPAFDQSQIFKLVYDDVFARRDGEPFDILIGDYRLSHHSDDVDLLTKISGVAASADCPFISAAAPTLFGLDSYAEFGKLGDLAKIFDTAEHEEWRAFRESEDSRFVVLTLPRVLSRRPYAKHTSPFREFAFEETKRDSAGGSVPMRHEHYAWMSPAFVYGMCIARAFQLYGWFERIKGKEGGGLIEGLPTSTFLQDDGTPEPTCPAEISIGERRDAELSRLGLLPLSHCRGTDRAVFAGCATMQRPRKYDRPEATEHATLHARLPFVLVASRIAHYLKVIARDKPGGLLDARQGTEYLDRWINQWVCRESNPTAGTRAVFPFSAARVEVFEIEDVLRHARGSGCMSLATSLHRCGW